MGTRMPRRRWRVGGPSSATCERGRQSRRSPNMATMRLAVRCSAGAGQPTGQQAPTHQPTVARPPTTLQLISGRRQLINTGLVANAGRETITPGAALLAKKPRSLS